MPFSAILRPYSSAACRAVTVSLTALNKSMSHHRRQRFSRTRLFSGEPPRNRRCFSRKRAPNRPSPGRLRFAVIVIAVNHVVALLCTYLRAGRAEVFSVFKILFVDFKLSPGLRFPRFVIRRRSRRFQGSADPAHRCLIKGRHIVILDDFPIAIQNHPPGICAVLFAFHQKKPSVLNDLRVDHTPGTGFAGDNIMFRFRRQRRGIAVCPSKEAVKGDGFTVFPEITGDGRPRPQHQYVSRVDAAEFVRPLGKAGQLFIERCRSRSGWRQLAKTSL